MHIKCLLRAFLISLLVLHSMCQRALHNFASLPLSKLHVFQLHYVMGYHASRVFPCWFRVACWLFVNPFIKGGWAVRTQGYVRRSTNFHMDRAMYLTITIAYDNGCGVLDMPFVAMILFYRVGCFVRARTLLKNCPWLTGLLAVSSMAS